MIAVLLVAATLALAPAPSTADRTLTAAAQSARAAAGARPLRTDPVLTVMAQRWAQRMAADGRLRHSGLMLRRGMLGENVGTGPTPEAIATAFDASPTHHANAVSPTWRRIGVGTATATDGALFVTELFAQ